VKHTLPLLLVAGLTLAPGLSAQQAADDAPVLAPTNHPHLPADVSKLWMAPDRRHVHTAAMNEFAKGV